MLIQKNFPTVIFDDDGVLTDISFYMLSYGRDPYTLPMVAAEDYLYFGRYKPFNMVYVEMAVPNATAASLNLEYYNGTAWMALSGVIDDSNGLTRSGSIQFTQPEDWSAESVGGQSKFFIRMVPSVDIDAGTEVQGINLVFSDDSDLEGVYPGVSNYKATSELSFILRHENSRNLIVQEIRNRGLRKFSSTKYENVDAWDLLAHDEVRQWSIYLTMANIFSSLQSKEDGLYKQKTEEYTEMAEMFKAAFYITLDRDDDGVVDADESAGDISIRRLRRG